jgi:hypothetical protein
MKEKEKLIDKTCHVFASEKDSTSIDNNLIKNPAMSSRAFKLLCIGLSQTEHYKYNKLDLADFFKEGLHTIHKAVVELRKLGHLHLKNKTTEDGKMDGYEWFWFEDPITVTEFNDSFVSNGEIEELS